MKISKEMNENASILKKSNTEVVLPTFSTFQETDNAIENDPSSTAEMFVLNQDGSLTQLVTEELSKEYPVEESGITLLDVVPNLNDSDCYSAAENLENMVY